MSTFDTLEHAVKPLDRVGETVTTLADLAEKYVTARLRRGELTRLSGRNTRVILSSLTATFRDRPVGKLTRRHIEKWLETTGHLKASTRRTQFSAVRQFTLWLVANGYVAKNPMADMKPPKRPRTTPRAMPADHITFLLDACPDARARAIVALEVGLGLRCCEVAGAKVEDWDRRGGTLRVTGKGGHEREVPVPDMVASHVAGYLAEYPATVGPLIRSYVEGWAPLQAATISRQVGLWMREAGVKVTAHDGVAAHALRHTAASDVLDRCGDLTVVQEMLGHRDLSSTSIYLRRAGMSQMRKAMEGRAYRSSFDRMIDQVQTEQETT